MSEELQQLSYARKYRPRRLSEYVGNEKSKRQVMAKMQSGILAQSMIAYGSAGGGKTSLGRLIAKEYLCENRDLYEGACGECANCKEMEQYIATGKMEDLMISDLVREIDVAKARGVDDIERIIEDADRTSFGGEWRIWILDEVQKASDTAQQSMLKLIEEPPERTLWIFCTTDPEKLNKALYTRFQLKLEIKKPTLQDITQMMINIANAEGFEYDKRGLAIIANRNNYTPRDALNSLEQIVVEHGNAHYESVIEYMQDVADEIMFEFFNALSKRDIMRYVNIIHSIKTTVGIEKFVNNLADFINRGIFILNDSQVEGMSEKELVSYKKLFSSFSVGEIYTLLERMIDMSGSMNCETKLLMLGYSGLRTPTVENKVTNNSIVSANYESELSIEKESSLKATIDKNKIDETIEKESISDLMESASEDDILSLFGAEEAIF